MGQERQVYIQKLEFWVLAFGKYFFLPHLSSLRQCKMKNIFFIFRAYLMNLQIGMSISIKRRHYKTLTIIKKFQTFGKKIMKTFFNLKMIPGNPISGTWSITIVQTHYIFAKVVNHKLFWQLKWAPILHWVVIYSILFRKLHHGNILSIVYFIWLWYGECGTNMIIDGKALGIYLFTIFGLTLSTIWKINM